MNELNKYNLVRDQMRTGDLLQWRSNSLLGKLIRWKTGAKVNHSSLVIRMKEYEGLERRVFTTEALEHGIILNLLSKRLQDHAGSVWWYPLKVYMNEKRQSIGEEAFRYMGIGYDYLSLFKQIIGKVNVDAKKLFCSEYVYLCYGYIGKAPNPGEMMKLGIFEEPTQIC